MVCIANDLLEWKDFPKGLKVLLLDEDIISGNKLRSKVEEMDYVVYVFHSEDDALLAISHKPKGFRLAIVEVTADNEDGSFKFLKRGKDLPTIMTSDVNCISTMMKCIALAIYASTSDQATKSSVIFHSLTSNLGQQIKKISSCSYRKVKMATRIIADLKPGDGDQPIEIKVIRKWSHSVKHELCFIFIGKNGDAIQACASLSDKKFFDPLIKVNTCYILTNYICEAGKTFMITVPHTTGVRLGKAAKFQEIPGDGFPTYYFNFVGYDHLSSRLDEHTILTDYIGKIENVTNVFKTKSATIMRIKLESLSEVMIDATFWDDAAVSFNKEAVNSLPSPVIAVVTSMKVTDYYGRLQLTATPASYIYINPDIDEAKTMAADFVVRDTAKPVLKIEYEKSVNPADEKNRNRFTLTELLSQNPNRYVGVQFTCKATLKNVDETKGWYYLACDQCRKKLQPWGKTFACQDHQPVTDPKHLYLLAATVVDNTSEAKATFFNTSATMLLETDCKTIITHLGFTDPHTLPAPLIDLIGKARIFQMRFSGSSKKGSMEFVVDNVFEDTVSLQIQTKIYQSSNAAPATPVTPAPATPSLAQLPPCTEPKHPQKSAVKRGLFQTPEKLKKQKYDSVSGQKKKGPTPMGDMTQE